jgi:alkanesulfonate monooxygenase SsuD/methylene tetrahydromethanopterin reductase-like flavin-dependent oxidoreductase (luciferase family)
VKASFLCGVHYEDPIAQQHNGWPTPPRMFDPDLGLQTFDHFLDYAVLAEELGFDWVSVSEHHFTPLILTPSVAAIAGALSQRLKRAKIALFGPLAPISNPIRTAEEIAQLDMLTHGRLLVLPLRGTPNEFTSYQPLEPLKARGMTQEATLLIQKALTEEQPFSWQGEYFSFPTIAVWPRSVQRPFPPMFYSGNSVDSAKFAGAHRLGMCISFLNATTVAETVAVYRAEAAQAGWEPSEDQIVYRGFVIVADTAEEAARLEAGFLPAATRQNIARNVTANRGAGALPADWQPLATAPPRSISAEKGTSESAAGSNAPDQGPVGFGLGRLLFAGTPDVLVDRIREFNKTTGVGVLDLIFSAGQTPPAAVRRSLELFGRDVLPHMRDIGEPAGSLLATQHV